MAALGAQSIASSYEQLLHVDRDGGGNTTTHVAIKDGDNGTTFGFTIATDALMMSSTNRLEFGDTGTYIHQSADGVLDLVSDTEIEINATTIDINGAVAMDGAMTGGTNITISGELDAATLDISGNADIAGTTNLDAVDIDGNVQLDGTFTIGTDGSGQDVTFYSATSGDSFAWDASEEKLTITGTNGQTALDIADGNLVVADNIDLEGDIDVNGTANLDVVDIDGAFTQDGGVVVFNEAGADYDFRVESNGNANMLFVDAGNDAVGIGLNSPGDYSTSADNLVIYDANHSGITIASPSNKSGNLFFADAASGDTEAPYEGFIQYDHGNVVTDAMMFGTAGSEKMRITSAGVLELTAGQIKFPASQSASADANTLDDYEEGTITPSLAGASSHPTNTFQARGGYYTKIGDRCYWSISVEMNGSGITPGSGTLSVDGLPFTVLNNSNNQGGISIGHTANWLTGQHGAPTSGFYNVNSTSFFLVVYDNDAGNIAGMSYADAADVDESTNFTASGHYKVA